jgi:hypothetical protein
MQDNWVMSSERIGIEWGFGKVYARCPILRKPHVMKLQARDVAKLVRVCVLLSNAHTCINGSQSSLYFNCKPPPLNVYFG